MELDAKDKKLLYEIDLNARLGTSELGKRIGVSQERTHYRLKRLEERKIITGFNALLDFSKMGYTGYAVYARFQNVNDKRKKIIIEGLKKDNHIYWIASFGGRFDLAFAIMSKNIVEFNEVLTKISTKYNKYLKDLNVAIRVELVQFPREYLLNTKSLKTIAPRFGKHFDDAKID